MKHFSLAQVALPLLLSTTRAFSSAPARRATTCNGYSEFCDRSYGNISFVGAHDSYAVGTDDLAANQDYGVTQQLNDGIRMLQLQAHNLSGTIELCHTSCDLYDGGSLEKYLTTVKTWMDGNTTDVVSILIVNYDNLAATAYQSVYEAVGLDTLSFSPSNASLAYTAWPTLGEMIGNGTRLVTYLDNQADYASVSWLLDEFTNIWETAYDVTSTDFNCNVNRSKGDSSDSSTEMYLINHFLDESILGELVPDVAAANQTNAVNGTGSLGTQVDTCETEWGRPPNFMLVDYYEYGNGSVFEVAATINGVKYDPTVAVPTPKSSSSSSSGTPRQLNSGLVVVVASVLAGSILAAI
ncbi:PLC-like phosphodiesterase [Fistulina hepatica ATCC 64428]|uniref:PLC-like phosphodiesterase n=1 Tax=Fistulina hepatica ATCC 64428 TaxID=1128425 RepID=A0A0D7AI49_9AGAR|nr:PLC-like phosphodiesterase [Fistulina hepatica ATCC 64428]